MTQSTARDIARATARRESGLARVSAITMAFGLAGVLGSAGLAAGLAATQAGPAATVADPTQSSGSSSDESKGSQPTVGTQTGGSGSAHATSGGS